MSILDELECRGWCEVPCISTQTQFLELVTSLGIPIQSPTGELVKTLTPAPATKARPATFSAKYGTGSFPYHTDTAFWPLPARFVLLRAVGTDMRRPTIVTSFADVFRQCGPASTRLVDRSVWLVRAGAARFYCSMRFRHENRSGWRYDSNCMIPVNWAAREVDKTIRPVMQSLGGHEVTWAPQKAIILANWRVFHARGPEPSAEGKRILERIYVR